MSISTYPEKTSFTVISSNGAGGLLSYGGTLTPGLWQYSSNYEVLIGGNAYPKGSFYLNITATTTPAISYVNDNLDKGLSFSTSGSAVPDSNTPYFYLKNFYYGLTGNSTYLWSTNGLSWATRVIASTITGASSVVYSISAGPTYYIAVAGPGKVVISTNGTSWTTTSLALTAGTSHSNYANIYKNGQYVLGINDSTSTNVLVSTDGLNWTTSNSTFTTGSKYIAHNGSTWLLIGGANSDQVRTSTDALTWTTQSALSYNVTSIAGITGGFAVTYARGYSYSTDGITWTNGVIYATSSVWRTSSYGNLMAVAGNPNINQVSSLANNTLHITEDAISWSTKNSVTLTAFSSGRVMGVGVGKNNIFINGDNSIVLGAGPNGAATALAIETGLATFIKENSSTSVVYSTSTI